MASHPGYRVKTRTMGGVAGIEIDGAVSSAPCTFEVARDIQQATSRSPERRIRLVMHNAGEMLY